MIKDPKRTTDFWEERRVLITGIGGFVATHLARRLVDLGANVTGVLRDSRGVRRLGLFGLLEEVNIVRGSIYDNGLMERVLNEYEIDCCFHLAAQALVGVANRSPVSTFESNIAGTWSLLEAARHAAHLQGLVLASSDKVYGDQETLPYSEETPLLATYPYDASKLCADVLARSYAATYELPICVARCANIYGGGDLNWSRIIPGTIRSMLAGEEPIIRSDGSLERDYLYVSDAVGAYLALAQHASQSQVRGEAFNFGWGRGHSALEVVEAVLKQGGSKLRPRVLGRNQGEISRQWLDAEKATRVLDWAPAVELEEGVRRTIEWYATYFGQESRDADRALVAV